MYAFEIVTGVAVFAYQKTDVPAEVKLALSVPAKLIAPLYG